MHPRGSTKAPASPHTTSADGADREGAPGQSEGERGRRESRRRDGGWNIAIAAYPVTGKKLIEKWLASKNKDIFMDQEGKS